MQQEDDDNQEEEKKATYPEPLTNEHQLRDVGNDITKEELIS